jgi:hypothetical protein
MLEHCSTSELIEDYAVAAAEHGRNQDCDPEAANLAYGRLRDIYRELRRRGPEAQSALGFLLVDEEPSIRLWAASHSLEFDPARGELILEELSRGKPGPIRLDAEMVLKQWRKGLLHFE